MITEQLKFDKDTKRYICLTPYRDIPSIEFWTYFLMEEIEDAADARWYARRLEKAEDGGIGGGNTMVMFLENGQVIIRDECEQGEEVKVGRCEYEAAKKLLLDWARVLEEKPEKVELIQEGDRLSLIYK